MGSSRQGVECHRCGSRMYNPSHDDDPMYCIVCGAQGDMLPPQPIRYSRNGYDLTDFTNTNLATIYIARYDGTGAYANGLREQVVRYRMTHGDKHTSLPALAVECPWCKEVTVAQTWHRLNTRGRGDARSMYIECTTRHTFSMVCADDGNYYWR